MLSQFFNHKYVSSQIPELGYDHVSQYIANKSLVEHDNLNKEKKRSFIEKEFQEIILAGGIFKNLWRIPFNDLNKGEKEEFRKSSLDIARTIRYNRFMKCIIKQEDEEKLNRNIEPFVWYKNINFPIPDNYYIKKRQYDFPTIRQKKLIPNLKNVPVFVLKNGFGDILTYNSNEEYRKNWINKIVDSYSKTFFWSEDDREITLIPIFFNYYDAQELKEEIYNNYSYSAEEIDIQIQAISLDKAYELNRKSEPELQFRFIPDLQELGKLVDFRHRVSTVQDNDDFKAFDQYGFADILLPDKCALSNQANWSNFYKLNDHIKFHEQQFHGIDFFQGQPIYRIMPVIRKYKNQEYHINYLHNGNPVNNNINYYFTRLEDTLKAWEEFRIMHKKLNLPKKPQIIIYNLESLLQDYELNKNLDFISEKFYIIPSKETYQIVKNIANHKNKLTTIEVLLDKLNPQILTAKVWSKRLWLSLLSKQFPSI
jgi:hypothetical protein